MNNNYKIKYDGYFKVGKDNIFYYIEDDKKQPVEFQDNVEKIVRYFNFFSGDNHFLFCTPVYDDIEKLQNITNEYAKAIFEKNNVGKK